MKQVAILTDSNVCLPKEVVEEYGIYIVPFKLAFEGRSYRNGVDITTSEFYQLLRKAKNLPTTSAPSLGDYLEAYRELSKQTKEILCITLTAKVSMAFDSAQKAAELVGEEIPDIKINVLDSQTAAGAQGFVVLAAAKAAASGQDLAKVTEVAKQLMPKVNLIATLDTLDYLARGGRVPNVIAWASSLLEIKPIVGFSQGEGKPLGRARTKHRAVERLLEIAKEQIRGRPVHINLMHSDVLDEAEELKKQVLTQFNCVELYITQFTPVMGVHTGPGVLALAFYCD